MTGVAVGMVVLAAGLTQVPHKSPEPQVSPPAVASGVDLAPRSPETAAPVQQTSPGQKAFADLFTDAARRAAAEAALRQAVANLQPLQPKVVCGMKVIKVPP